MRARSRKTIASSEAAFDFTFYVQGFTTRSRFEKRLQSWLEALDKILSIEFVVRDEMDVTTSRYAGAEWLKVSDYFIHSYPKIKEYAEQILFELSSTLQGSEGSAEEKDLLGYVIKAIHGRISHHGNMLPHNLARYADSKSALNRLATNRINALVERIESQSQLPLLDVIFWDDLGKVIHNIQDLLIKFELVRIVSRRTETFEVVFQDGYKLANVFKLAILNENQDILQHIRNFLEYARPWQLRFFQWFSYHIHDLSEAGNNKAALQAIYFIFEFNLSKAHDFGRGELMAIFPNAIHVATELYKAKELDTGALDDIVGRCLKHARNCPAIYAIAGTAFLQQKRFKKALNAFQQAFNSNPPSWPAKQVAIHPSAYCNALWVLLEANSGLKTRRKTIMNVLHACLPHSEKNPAIYTNASLVYAQLKDYVTAKEYYELSRKHDPQNFLNLREEIDSHAALIHFKRFINDQG